MSERPRDSLDFTMVLLILLVLALSGLFAAIGAGALITGHLDTALGRQPAGRMFPRELHGISARVGGASLVCLSACFASILLWSPRLAARLHFSVPIAVPLAFFVGWVLLFFAARHLGGI